MAPPTTHSSAQVLPQNARSQTRAPYFRCFNFCRKKTFSDSDRQLFCFGTPKTPYLTQIGSFCWCLVASFKHAFSMDSQLLCFREHENTLSDSDKLVVPSLAPQKHTLPGPETATSPKPTKNSDRFAEICRERHPPNFELYLL